MSNDPDTGANDGDGPQANAVTRVLRTVLPDFVRRRFALKFALVLVIMGVILSGLGFVATGALSNQVEDNTQVEYEQLASQQATIVEKWIERNSVSVRLASQSNGLTGTPNEAGLTLNEMYGTLVGNADSMHLVSYANETPQIIARSTGIVGTELPVPLSETSQAWVSNVGVQNMDASEVAMSNVYRKGEDLIIGFVSKVRNTPSRYLVVEYYADNLGMAIESDTRENHFAQIVNSDGIVQVDSRMGSANSDATLLTQYGNSQTVSQAMQEPGEDATRTAGVRIVRTNPTVVGEPYAVGYASIEVADQGIEREWALVTHAPTSDLFALVNTVSRWGQIVTLIGAVLIAIVGATMGYSTARSIDRLRQKVAEMEEGNLEVDVHSGRIDSIGQLYDGFASMRDALRQQITEAEQARKEAEVARAEAMEMNEYLQEKAEEYSAIMEQCAAGDLTQRMEVDRENDAMDQIATDFNDMIDELEKTTGQLKHFADEVEEAGNAVETSAESVRDASEQVAESIQHISDDAHNQQERLEELSASIDQTIEQFERIAADSNVDVSDSVDQLRGVADAINDLVDLTDEMMAESENVAGAAEEQAAELNSVSQQARDLTRYARPLKDVLESFETE
ncbi:MAG: HAMP domain-containing protein, partial [Halorhabdus sp.]